jgi:radical S-adenosyl methionine domain-containing protein 2
MKIFKAMKKQQTLIPSVNFHLWEPCNFSCKFCFATFQDVRQTILPKGHLPKEDALKIIAKLAEAGFSKITFVGGEPTLCPWIGDLIVRAKVLGLTTMIVTNGSKLNEKFLKDVNGFLDWVVLSIDSIRPEINYRIGRSQNHAIIPNEEYYLERINLVKEFGMRLKINTVVNRKNYRDYSMGSFIKKVHPERWKVFQALRMEGQNDLNFEEIKISTEQFLYYQHLNSVNEFSGAVIEKDVDMQGTYIMVDPAGRFFDNTKGYHTYSEPILKVGVEGAIQQISYDFDRFIERGGLYA